MTTYEEKKNIEDRILQLEERIRKHKEKIAEIKKERTDKTWYKI